MITDLLLAVKACRFPSALLQVAVCIFVEWTASFDRQGRESEKQRKKACRSVSSNPKKEPPPPPPPPPQQQQQEQQPQQQQQPEGRKEACMAGTTEKTICKERCSTNRFQLSSYLIFVLFQASFLFCKRQNIFGRFF